MGVQHKGSKQTPRCMGAKMAKELIFVNAYEVSREYGGGEEGGWWYDMGTPLASVPCRGRKAAKRERKRLMKLYAHLEGDLNSVSTIGRTTIQVYFEEELAAPFPRERPYYC